MAKQRVLLLGATGETGSSILEGLIEYGKFEVAILVRPASAEKPAVKKIADRGVEIRVVDIAGSIDDLVSALSGIDVFISAIDADTQLAQNNIATAAKKAGVKRFVPCGFTTISPAGGVMMLRDDKEEVYNHVKRLFLPYTIIDVGFWYQISFPPLPSGRISDAHFDLYPAEYHGDGEAPNMLTDLRDIGRYVARIIDDERTLNKYVACYDDVLSEKQIVNIMEELSGEKIEMGHVSVKETEESVAKAIAALAQDPNDFALRVGVYVPQYVYSKYIRKDNTPEYAKYLGYLDAGELYPDFKPIRFRDFVVELLDGKITRPYANKKFI